MQVACVLCVRPHGRAAWIPVPVKQRGTESCVALTSSKSPWAIRALTGFNKGRTGCGATLVLRAFESDVRAQANCEQTEADRGLQPDDKRQRLCDTDTEDADDSQDSSPPKHGSPKQYRATRVDIVGFTTVAIGGLDVKVGFYKGPGVLLPATTEAVSGVLKFLDQRYDELLEAGRELNGKRLAARKDGPQELLSRVPPFDCANGSRAKKTSPANLSQTDTNKVRFDFRCDGFQIKYTDADGAPKTLTKGFVVSRNDAVTGLVLAKPEYKKLKKDMLHKARMTWNELDKSSAPRLKG